jgi:hypothetical protein
MDSSLEEIITQRKLAVQLSSVILIISLVTGCSLGTTPTSAPQIVSPSAATSLTTTPDPLLAELKAAMLKVQPNDTRPLDQTEQDMTDLLRETSGVRAALGDQADAIFLKIDEAKAAAVQELVNQAGETSSLTPTAEESMALSAIINTLGISALSSGDYQIVAPTLSLGMLVGTSFIMDQAPRDANGNTSIPKLELMTTTKDDVSIYIGFTPRMNGSRMEGEVEMVISVTTPVAYEETSNGTLSVELCPDAEGNVPLRFSFQSSSNMNSGGMQMGAETQATGHVDDEAKLASFDLQTTTSGAHQPGLGAPKGSPNQFIEANLKIHGSITNPDDTSMAVDFTRASSQTDLKFAQSMTSILGVMNITMTFVSLMVAEMKWADGFCLEIKVPEMGSGTKTVPPNSETQFTANVRHKFEGVELPLPVTAVLSAGQVSVSPSRTKVVAPASFTHKAGDQEKQTATVSLETRSRRGVAKLDIKFRTAAPGWKLEGMGPTTLNGASITSNYSCDSPYGPWEFSVETTTSPTSKSATKILFSEDGKSTATVEEHASSELGTVYGIGTGNVTITPNSGGYQINFEAYTITYTTCAPPGCMTSRVLKQAWVLNIIPADPGQCHNP